MLAAARIEELLEALRAAQLYRAPEQGEPVEPAARTGSWLDTRSNDYLGLAAATAELTPAPGPARSDVPGTGRPGALDRRDLRARGVGAVVETGAADQPGAVEGFDERLSDLRPRPAAEPEDRIGSWVGAPTAAAAAGARSVSRETARPVSRAAPVGAGASRLVSGTTPEHVALEQELAEWLGAEACLIFSSAYAANVGALSALALQGDALFSDELNHASIIDGCRLSRAETVVVPHRNLAALAAALARPRPARSVAWVVTESYFSMDGTSPDFLALRELCDRHQATLVVDETHSLGLFGPAGRGLAAAAGVQPDVLIGGLGKAFGLQGGFVAAPLSFQQWLWNRARSFVFSTGVSPWLCGRARLHLQWIRTADAERSQLSALAMRLERALRQARVPLPDGRHGPLFPVVFGTESATLTAARELEAQGIRAQPIRPPTVPRGSARLRVTLRADMTEQDVDRLASALTGAWLARARASEATPGSSETAESPASSTRDNPLTATPSSPPAALVPQSGDSAQLRWIVLGTGTGVGKSYVAEALVRALAAGGGPAAGLKPVETGCRTSPDGQPREGDAALLEAASSRVKHPRPHPLYGFREPIAPSLAAHREGQRVDVDAIASWVDRVRCSTAPGQPAVVIETAGGVFSPLAEDATNFELARALGDARWLLVAPDRLGVLHDVTSTLRAMAALGRSPDLLVLSAPEQPDASTGTNAAELARLGLTLPLLELGRHQPEALAALLDPRPCTAAE